MRYLSFRNSSIENSVGPLVAAFLLALLEFEAMLDILLFVRLGTSLRGIVLSFCRGASLGSSLGAGVSTNSLFISTTVNFAIKEREVLELIERFVTSIVIDERRVKGPNYHFLTLTAAIKSGSWYYGPKSCILGGKGLTFSST